jgi:hypothetical protein
MPCFNVEVTKKTTMVVEAADCDEAADVAAYFADRGFSDDLDATPRAHVTGSVTHERHLHSGWDGNCHMAETGKRDCGIC